MAKESKTAVIYFRIKPSLKDALAKVAEKEIRSVGQMLEVMILDYLRRHNIKYKGQ